ncbi:src kinase-associated phosphoprotein 1-like isoform X1 [Oncorhynchus nerka]|uniref:src kinase-associated phosphoprotein 1-like isoform X1 n=1 Tax=Oncorhynchus nerka TaxID=8023 RepID=UPI0011312848|nr:src kinase-associated phosphoprotein 1-like isoform X1 [Oncorhynchus nerka]XP_029485108.1 src kinase-associated phosphoprotein 1-like isoform X1 [Oncorhynchus nerka]XP_029485109.1 src kinase-associated phosphoprotein 1-like isoform X1 [Oncorhynchus nerka]
MGTVSEEVRRLLNDCELFVSDILQDENLSKHARETRGVLLNNFRVIYSRNPQAFPFRSESRQEDSSDDNQSSSLGRSAPSEDLSVASDYQDEGSLDYFEEIQMVAAQDLSNILKQGYLEKKRQDHSFFSLEWQKRWCVLKNTIFYYFGSDKDKQQKGAFYIKGYSAEMVANLRKDSKKNACFELSAPGRHSFQFTASSVREAREWVDQINFVLKDLSSSFIPFEDETYDDIEGVTGVASRPPWPAPFPVLPQQVKASLSSQEEGKPSQWEEQEEDDIYEVLPEDDIPGSIEEISEKSTKPVWSIDYANYYQGLWDCEADETDELAFQRGDLIYIVSKVSINKEYNINGWWVGELNGTIGIVPKDFLHPAYIL